ncbi:MAG: carbohydrate kinase, partial [Pseudomonadota bacterium]|nr:carbohydrate kinase [Pseudomonadota bacterium]
MHPRFTVCGGCHIDRQLRFESPPLPGRTAPASQSERVGGVATNIAVQLAALNAGTRLVSVQPPQSHDAMKARLAEAGVDPFLLPLAGEPPSYTALLGPDGELLTGAAAMALYDSVSA